MGFGSVRFFRRLFSGLLLLALLAPTCFAIVFGIGYARRSRDYVQAMAQVEQLREIVRTDTADARVDASQSIELGGAVGERYAYQNLYPDCRVERGGPYADRSRTVYLTFDDGPSERTDEILDILAQKGAKATFFVVYRDTEEDRARMRRIVEEGHAIGVHSSSHRYAEIYSSVEAFLDDFYREWRYIEEVTGVRTQIFRFPGGSINAYNAGNYQEIIGEMVRRGFAYYDWNVSAGDAGAVPASRGDILRDVLAQSVGKSRPVVLLHDSAGKTQTVAALGELIDTLAAQGYAFDRITDTVRPVIMPYRDASESAEGRPL